MLDKITKYQNTYWMRLHTVNKWVFSTAVKEAIFIQYKRVEITTETINGTKIIIQTDHCAAHTTNSIFLAPETINTESQIIIFNHTNLRQLIHELAPNKNIL